MVVVRLALLAMVFLGPAFAGSTAQAETYPAKPVTMVVPFAPGSTTDVITRMIGEKLQERLGQPFPVEYKLGGGGIIGAEAAAKATPDGYTLLVGSSGSMAINPTLHKSLPYDPERDFIPLALVARAAFILVANPSLPIRSVQDLVAFARRGQAPLTYGSVGPGSPHHLYGELLSSVIGTEMTHVPYRGSVQPLQDVVAGQIQLMFCDFAVAGQMILTGKVRPLGVTTKERLSVLPDVPSLLEVGMPEFDSAAWILLAAPAGIPKDVAGTLRHELQAVMNSPEIRDWMARNGLLPGEDQSTEALQAFLKSEIGAWGRLIDKAGIAGSQ